MTARLPISLVLFAAALRLAAAPAATGTISGTVVAEGTGAAIEYATVDAHHAPGGALAARTATDGAGAFRLPDLPLGDYELTCSALGGEPRASRAVSLTTAAPDADLGRWALPAGGVVQMEKVSVTASRAAFYNSIDRKVYSVGSDLQSTAGSASGLLQNVPSVEVDVEGNVSLRGNSNVLILLNGQPSSLMSSANRADVLDQMPADAIERVEVITNPSAQYRPDGTAGIINLVLKHDRGRGWSGAVRANVGNAGRANAGVSANYNPGRYNVYGTVNVRQDDRQRSSSETRSHPDAASGATIDTVQRGTEHMRPLARLVELGLDYNASPTDTLRASVSNHHVAGDRRSTVTSLAQTRGGPVNLDFDRERTGPEWHDNWEGEASWRHTFGPPDHTLEVRVQTERHEELEENHYRDLYRVPTQTDRQEETSTHPLETTNTLTADYAVPLPDNGRLTAGYAGDANRVDTDFRSRFLDPVTGDWRLDPTRTNRFIYQNWIDAGYVTYGRTLGAFGLLAGLRVERTLVHTDQVTQQRADRTEYYRLHPTLHLNYNLTDTAQLQLNYSHRVHRPHDDDLNPFPEYQDPYNLRAGNPKLLPEETHSIEGGYQYHRDNTTLLAAVYYRDTYHAFTTVTRYIDAVTLLTTHENLASSQSGGLEVVATTPIGSTVNVNFSANAFYSDVDASNLGFAGRRSTIAWDMKLNAEWRATKADLVQLDTNYSAKRLTAQGYRQPRFYLNLGWRHDFEGKNLAVTATITDVFNSLKERSIIATPTLHDELIRRRSSRTVYVGFIYSFGKPDKKTNDLDFDDSP